MKKTNNKTQTAASLHQMKEALKQQAELRIYSVHNAEEIVEKIMFEYSNHMIDLETFVQITKSLIFRDKVGDYWIFDVANKMWEIYDNGWIPKGYPLGPLEGASDLNLWLLNTDSMEDEPLSDEDLNDILNMKEQDSKPVKYEDVLAKIINETYQEYMNGQLTSTATDTLLKEYQVIDKQAQFWSMGCHSKNWYCFNGEVWKQVKHAPSNDIIATPEDIKELNEQIKQNVLMIFETGVLFLPEPVALPWNPPKQKIYKVKSDDKVTTKHQDIKKEIPHKSITIQLCSKCHNKLQKGQKFCTDCGTKTDNAISKYVCPKCGTEVTKYQKFCTGCGEKL